MGFRVLAPSVSSSLGSRVLICGGPNKRKTDSLHTWPRPLHIVSFPGEKGYNTIDTAQEGVHAYIWEFDDVTKASPHAIIDEVERLSWQILGGQKGPITTFAGAGLHKLYGCYYLRARLDLDSSNIAEDVKDARAYGRSHDDFTLYLTRVNQSTVPHAVFTVWDGKEPDKEGVKGSPAHIWPELPGKMAKRIMGEFNVVLNAQIEGVLPGPTKAWWQLQPGGFVWGAGVKIPARFAAKLPQRVEQNWTVLKAALDAAQESA